MPPSRKERGQRNFVFGNAYRCRFCKKLLSLNTPNGQKCVTDPFVWQLFYNVLSSEGGVSCVRDEEPWGDRLVVRVLCRTCHSVVGTHRESKTDEEVDWMTERLCIQEEAFEVIYLGAGRVHVKTMT